MDIEIKEVEETHSKQQNTQGAKRRRSSTEDTTENIDDQMKTSRTSIQRICDEGVTPFIRGVETNSFVFKSSEFVRIYGEVYEFCTHKDANVTTDELSKQLYGKAHVVPLEEYIHTVVNPTLRRSSTQWADTLKTWVQRWDKFKLVTQGLCRLLQYLDRFYTRTPKFESLPLSQKAYQLFAQHVLPLDHIESNSLVGAILTAFEQMRINTLTEGQMVEAEPDRSLVQDAVRVLCQLDGCINSKIPSAHSRYTSLLEVGLKKRTAAFYQVCAKRWLEKETIVAYLIKAERALAEEARMISDCLHESSANVLVDLVYTELLVESQEPLMEKRPGFVHLLETDSIADLTRLDRLYRAEHVAPLAARFHSHVAAVGLALVERHKGQEASEIEYVSDVLKLHVRFCSMVEIAFSTHSLVMKKSLKLAFEEITNSDARFGNLLARYAHEMLRRGSKLNVANVECTLDHVVLLFGLLRDKDIFEHDYHTLLSIRMLKDETASTHQEQQMIARFKTECGYSWTNKLEGMFKDIQSSREIVSKYNSVYHPDSDHVKLEPWVCTIGIWPQSTRSLSSSRMTIPPDLEPSCMKFGRFYANMFHKRKLEWRHDAGHAEVSVEFSPSSHHTLVTSTAQMLILLLFSDAGVLTFRQICDMAHLGQNEVANPLLSLCHPKVSVLLKHPNTKTLEEGHQFKLNPKFSNPLRRVVVPTLQIAETTDKKKNEEEKESALLIEVQRRHQIDACIVRIMKTRKTLRHPLLVSEVVQHIRARFTPAQADIKKRVEELLKMEYLRRDETDRVVYHYVA